MTSAGETAPESNRTTEERLRSILETTTDWIWEMDLAGRHTYSNRRIEATLGYTPQEFRDLFRTLLHPRDREDVDQRLPTLIEEKRGWSGWAVRWRHKEGHYRVLESNAHPILDAHGRLIGYRGVDRDITDRLVAEQQRRESERLYSSLADAVPVGIIRADPTGAWVHSNEKCVEITGRSREGLLGFGWAISLHEEDRDRVVELWSRIMRSREESSFECRFIGAGGRMRWVLVHTSPELDAVGEPTGFTGTITDITSRRAAEDQLRHAQKLDAIGQLAGGIAHDFNNVLAAILATAELIERVPGELEEGLDDIKGAVAQASALTKQLLSFARKDVAKLEIIDGNELISDMESMLRRLLPETIRFETGFSPEPLVTRVDRRQLEQVILNLVINARDAMPEGGVLGLQTSHATSSDGARRVRVRVLDDGGGIEPAVAERMFEPFFTTKPDGQGSGLGLATAYGIVTELGGEIGFDSTPGCGSTFEVSFPAVTGTPAHVSSPPCDDPFRGTELVLLCEDNTMLRDTTARLLRVNGYRVIESRDGLEAVRAANESPVPIDVLVCDVATPRLNGCEAARFILDQHPDAKTILMSGHAADLLEGFRDLDSDAACFLEKPFKGSDLLHTIRRLLDLPSSRVS